MRKRDLQSGKMKVITFNHKSSYKFAFKSDSSTLHYHLNTTHCTKCRIVKVKGPGFITKISLINLRTGNSICNQITGVLRFKFQAYKSSNLICTNLKFVIHFIK